MSIWMGLQWILLAVSLPALVVYLCAFRQSRSHFSSGIILLFGFIWAVGQHLEDCVFLYWPDEALFRAALYLCYLGM